uniref:VHS domain-containing protein n=1 Tax=Entamoeba invadens TaxID=33085 RepID=S0B5G8_ENTIV|nr:hypothetical protein [Entamoeba invadens]
MSVKLSELVSNLVNDKNEPSEVEMQTIVNAVERVIGADTILRLQIEQKMRNYTKKLVLQAEMINCLTLANYVVQNSPTFRTQVCELSFLTLLQQVGKMRKVHTETDEVEDKVRELIAVWGCFYPNELSEYAVLYQKYCSHKVIDPKTKPTVFLPNEITRLIPHVEHNLRNVVRAIECMPYDVENVFNYASKILIKFDHECLKCRDHKDKYDEESYKEMEAIGKRLTFNLKILKQKMDSRKKKNNNNFPETKFSSGSALLQNAMSTTDTAITRPTKALSSSGIFVPQKTKRRSKGQSPVFHSFVLPETSFQERQFQSSSTSGLQNSSSCHFVMTPPFSPEKGADRVDTMSPNMFDFDEEMA